MDNTVIFNDLNPQTWPRRAGGMDVRPGVVKKKILSRFPDICESVGVDEKKHKLSIIS